MSSEAGANPPPQPAHPAVADDRVATILRDIECPSCGYNLRGLHGPIVDCPECGQRCDVPRMVAARWTGPWWKAPGFNTVLMPTAWLLMSFIAVVIVSVSLETTVATIVVPVVVIGLTIFFGFLMWRSWKLFGGVRGVWLALLGHVILVGYGLGIVGVISFLLGVILTVADVIDRSGRGWAQVGLIGGNLLLVLLCGVMVWGCRRGEWFIAEQCIKRHLAKRRGLTP